MLWLFSFFQEHFLVFFFLEWYRRNDNVLRVITVFRIFFGQMYYTKFELWTRTIPFTKNLSTNFDLLIQMIIVALKQMKSKFKLHKLHAQQYNKSMHLEQNHLFSIPINNDWNWSYRTCNSHKIQFVIPTNCCVKCECNWK